MKSLEILNFIGWNYFVIFIFCIIYILFKRNKQNSYYILTIYSIFIESIYFVEPFIISIDYVIAYYQKMNNINEFKEYLSYKVILYIIIPFCKNYYFSGYFRKKQK